MNDTKNIKVLHYFNYGYLKRYSGHTIRWVRIFESWSDSRITHLTIDQENYKIISATSNRAITHVDDKILTKIKMHLGNLSQILVVIRDRDLFQVIHLHTIHWGGLLLILISKFINKPVLFESTLYGSDDPNSIGRERLGGLKTWIMKKLNAVIVVSPQLADEYGKFGIPYLILNNPVFSNVFKPVKNETQKNT